MSRDYIEPSPPAARVVEVIEVEFRRGEGVEGDPVRRVVRYYDRDGLILAENDPYGSRAYEIAAPHEDSDGR